MIYVAVAAIVALGLVTAGLLNVVRGMVRQHARERDALLDKIMHLAGRTWTPPPADQPPESEPDEEPLYVDPAHLTTWE